uniref:Uncharacterized protein n=1 Tax=Timema poppense TaxID=170557 RepID=A0A7R9CZG3_TIMPO|nr:unnamed protein product [Timema poppensis]
MCSILYFSRSLAQSGRPLSVKFAAVESRKSLQHDKGSAELTPAVQSPPTFPRSKGVTKVTAPVRPFRRASPEDKPVTTPLPAARRRKLLPKEEPELETPVPTQQPKPAKRAGKHLRKIYPTVEEEEENPKPVERIVSKVQPQVKDPLLKTSPAIQYLIDKKCLDESFIQLLKQFELNFKDGIFSYSVQESSEQKLNVNSVQKVIKIAQEYQELKSKAVGITNLPSPDKDIEEVVNNIPLLFPAIEVPDSLKCSTEVTDIKVLDATKDNPKPRTFVPIARANTLTSCTSGDYSEYSWYDAKSDKTYEFMDCGSGFYETVEVVSGSAIGENGGELRGSKDTIVPEDSDEDSVDIDVHIERMNHVNNQNTNRYQDEGPVVDTVYPDQVRRRVKSGSYSNGEPTSPTSSTSRKEKTSSGFFSFLRWFRKNKEGDDESEDLANREFEEGLSFPTAPSTPELLRSHSSSCGSVDTLFSTATATSFAFITPTCYRPFGGSNRPEKIIAVGPDTDTYRNRLRHRDRVRELDRNLTLRKKYRLFGSNTLLRSAPNTPNASPVLEKRSEVLRSNSESNDKLQPKQPNTSPGSQNSSFGKKKRKAPIPPAHPPSNMDMGLKSQYEQVVCNDSLKLERGVLKSNKDVPKLEIGVAENKVAPVSPRPWYKRNFTGRDSGGGGGIKRDIFKSLEKKKDKNKEEDWIPEGGIPRVVGTSVPNDGGSIGSSRFSFFSRLDRSDEKKKEEKRKSQVSMLANISELDREAAEIVQKEQAREQAMLVAQNAKFYSYPDEPRLKKLPIDDVDLALPVSSNVEVPKRSSARELISLFNSIGNVTKVTVNSTFFSKDGSSFFSKENGVEKRFSFVGESVKTEQRMVVEDCDNKSYEKKEIRQTRQSIIIDSNHSPVSSPVIGRKNIKISESSSKVTSLFDTKGIPTSNGTASGVVIEEVDDEPENASKTRAMYEANKLRRHHSPSPSIPTIAEQSETASSAASTVKTNPGSNRSSVSILPDIATVKATAQPPNTIHVKQPTVWACPRCTLENQRWKLTCEACGRWRPSNTEELNEVTPTSNVTTEVKKETDINWESEIKKYFPNLDVTANKTSQVNKKTDPKNDTKQVEEPTKICNGLPSTFIGGKLKQDMEKEKKSRDESVEPIKLNALINGGVAVFEEPDVDEVRKARLAFFNKTNTDGSQIDEISSEKTNEKIALNKLSCDENASDKGNEKLALNKLLSFDKNASAKANVKPGLNKLPLDENEQQKLREILKEMKNSLPKRPKKLVEKSDLMNVETTETKVTVPYKIKENVKVEKSQKLGAIKKIPKKTYEDIKSASNQKDSPVSGAIKDKVSFQNGTVDEKAEALLITRKTVIEDIKVKKSGPQKTEKVSTSAQTNAVVRKVDSSQYSDQKKEGEFLSPTISAKNMSQISPDILPVTVEEYSTAIKDGVLYTSLSKDSKKIGTGTFELIRARDFANIEATKTGNEANVVHVYANITNPLMESSSPFQQSVVTSKQTPVIQIPRPVATGEKGLAAGRAEVKLVESSHGEVSKGSPQPSSSGITSPELSSTRDARGSSIQSSRVSESSSCSMASAGSGDNSEVEKLTAQLTLPKGLADFKANLEAEQKVEHNMNTLAINRLLRRLEAAIAGGQHMLAAGLAKDLARLKISCSVTRHRRSLDTSPASITVDMYVEDKVSHQGPIPLQVTPVLTVAQLKDKVEQEFEIPAGVQRWILGKLLASDDSKTLADHSISSGGCPIFLYLVAPDGDHEGEGPTAADPHPNPGSVTKQELESKVESKDTPPGAKPGGGWYYNDDDERYSFCEDTESESSEEEDMPQPPKQNPIKPGTAMIAQLQQVTKVIKGQKEEEDSEELDDEDEEDSIEVETIPLVVVNDKPKVLVGPPSPTVPKFPLPGPSRQLTLVEQPDKPATSRTSTNSPTPSTSQTTVVLKPVTNQSPKPFRPARREAKVEKESVVAKAPVDKHPPVQPVKPAAPPEQPTGTLKLGWKCPVCTLVNSPTRPGCAACTTERPLKYVVPVEYRANDQELQRMQQEQQFDNELKQACWDILKQ